MGRGSMSMGYWIHADALAVVVALHELTLVRVVLGDVHTNRILSFRFFFLMTNPGP